MSISPKRSRTAVRRPANRGTIGYATAVHATAVNATAIYATAVHATAVPDRGVAHYVGAAASIWPPVKAQTTSSRDQRHIGAVARNR
jgi:hypothetical protein